MANMDSLVRLVETSKRICDARLGRKEHEFPVGFQGNGWAYFACSDRTKLAGELSLIREPQPKKTCAMTPTTPKATAGICHRIECKRVPVLRRVKGDERMRR